MVEGSFMVGKAWQLLSDNHLNVEVEVFEVTGVEKSLLINEWPVD